MEIKSVKASSFNGWTNEARPLVKSAISLLRENRGLSGRMARNLGEHSPYHFLTYNKGVLAAEANHFGADSFEISASDVALHGFDNALKRMTKFIAQQNTLMPKRWRRISFMWQNLSDISRRPSTEKGLVISEYTMPVYLSRFVSEAEKSKKSVDFQNVVRQIRRIDEKATENGLKVVVLPYKDGGVIISHGRQPLYRANKHASFERLNDTENYLDMYTKESQAAFPDWSSLDRYKMQAQPADNKQGFWNRILDIIFKKV